MEVLISILVVTVMAGVFVPMLQPQKGCRLRISCINNLKQVGLAFRMFSNDHGDQFPWAVPTAEGGSKESVSTGAIFPHYCAASNELSTPRILICSSDGAKRRVVSWDQSMNNGSLSYFAGLDADESRPRMFLTGDRNLTTNGRLAAAEAAVTSKTLFGIAPMLHTNYVNVGLADGSALQASVNLLQKLNSAQFDSIDKQCVRLAIP